MPPIFYVPKLSDASKVAASPGELADLYAAGSSGSAINKKKKSRYGMISLMFTLINLLINVSLN